MKRWWGALALGMAVGSSAAARTMESLAWIAPDQYGRQSDGPNGGSISPDGRWLRQWSSATNQDDPPGNRLRDLEAGTSAPLPHYSSITPDFRYLVVFTATSHVAEDTNTTGDYYRFDRITGEYRWIPVTRTFGGQPLDTGCGTRISDDGRYVLTIQGRVGCSLDKQALIELSDVVSGTRELVVRDDVGEPQLAFPLATLSADGRYVMFSRFDWQNSRLSRFDRITGARTTIPTMPAGAPLTAFVVASDEMRFDPLDGSLLLTTAADLDVLDQAAGGSLYRHDFATATTMRIPVATEALSSVRLFASGSHGRRLALAVGVEGRAVDGYVHDLADGSLVRLTRSRTGGGVDVRHLSLSSTDRYTFSAAADDVVAGDDNGFIDGFIMQSPTATPERMQMASVARPIAPTSRVEDVALSDDARSAVLYTDLSSGNLSTYVRDFLVLDRTTHRYSDGPRFRDALEYRSPRGYAVDAGFVLTQPRATRALETGFYPPPPPVAGFEQFWWQVRHRYSDGATTVMDAYEEVPRWDDPGTLDGRLSGDGRYVTYLSKTKNRTPLQPNPSALKQAFIEDATTRAIELVSGNAVGAPTGTVSEARPSHDGRYVVFRSDAPDLTMLGPPPAPQLYLRDRALGTTTLVTQTPAGGHSEAGGAMAQVSADGRIVAFISQSHDLVGQSVGMVGEAYVRDVVAGTTRRLTTRASEATHVVRIELARDGRFVLYTVASPSLSIGGSGLLQVHAHDLETGERVQASVDRNGVEGNGASVGTAITPDGSYAAIVSDATNWTLDRGLTGPQRDPFLVSIRQPLLVDSFE